MPRSSCEGERDPPRAKHSTGRRRRLSSLLHAASPPRVTSRAHPSVHSWDVRNLERGWGTLGATKTATAIVPSRCVDDAPHHELVPRLEEVEAEGLAGEHGDVVEESRQAQVELVPLRLGLACSSLQQLREHSFGDLRDHHVLRLVFRSVGRFRFVGEPGGRWGLLVLAVRKNNSLGV